MSPEREKEQTMINEINQFMKGEKMALNKKLATKPKKDKKGAKNDRKKR